jgi:L-histidine N-alpha-methyltransferase
MIAAPAPSAAVDRAASVVQFRADVLRGLGASQKSLPCKYFYDEAGSALFERITELDEYYPTRTELALMERYAPAMAGLLARRCLLIEYGSGSSVKTRLLLDHAHELAGYVPVDVSAAHLRQTAAALAAQYPRVDVLPLAADFSRPLTLPLARHAVARRVVYFPGSTIGNFVPDDAVALLKQTAALSGAGGGLLLGADLQKDLAILEAAYNDAKGVTAAFNLNLLARINRELGADFALDRYSHRAFYNAPEERIEMHLVSRQDQRVRIGDAEFFIARGEGIHTENSYKYTLPGLAALAKAAGFTVDRTWTDDRNYFTVQYWSAR